MLTQLPGFQDSVHDSQQTFRALLNALARPGVPQAITAAMTPPAGLVPSCAAAALTLIDLETVVWLQPEIAPSVRGWLLFHTGCRFTNVLREADFAFIPEVTSLPDLRTFCWGSPEYPEASTTLFLQCASLSGGVPTTLQGPGIQTTIRVDLPLPDRFWQQWQVMTTHYPLGLDIWCFSEHQVLGLPRTAQCSHSSEEL
ncbi:phosphonate C-P lyase system protein PhnH [Oscillatoria sp. CS-180]|uniref:phosphonate C-P lyase system protein PhnH n=1 Tax=Oscillatoria sp. CS-180 TaxID=3021720 RepID=UPI00232FADEB|nr:phosphonate C-P lyase system protein PhnH [Oscillatoria sp. CS-180]MDB9529043.1 phosphonate C-P lyase system protein PhnH [Oscillatoria sp. CS-180]